MKHTLTVMIAVTVFLLWRQQHAMTAPWEIEPPKKSSSNYMVSSHELQAAIELATDYLVRNCDSNGQFTYRVHLDPKVSVEPRYNILRHAGAIYAMVDSQQRHPKPATKAAILRAARFLQTHCIGQVAGNPKILAVWSSPDIAPNVAERQAKLGGAGLALIALLSVERMEPGFTPPETLRGLGRFLIFMQKPNGSFYSKYFPDHRGRDDRWRSQYYPGEAALALLMLYEWETTPQWLGAAARAVERIALDGQPQRRTFPDQWYLLATNRLLRIAQNADVPLRRQVVWNHAVHVCRDMMTDQRLQTDAGQRYGCYTDDGRTCPTATRLEGLLAAYEFLSDTDRRLSEEIWKSVQPAIGFLVRSQIKSGPHAGGISRAYPAITASNDDSQTDDLTSGRAAEIRIDYVQHALSAMMQYEAILIQRREAEDSLPGPTQGQ